MPGWLCVIKRDATRFPEISSISNSSKANQYKFIIFVGRAAIVRIIIILLGRGTTFVHYFYLIRKLSTTTEHKRTEEPEQTRQQGIQRLD